MKIRLGEFFGELAQRCKNGKWFVKWEARSEAWIKKYGKPPNSAFAPELFEVIDA